MSFGLFVGVFVVMFYIIVIAFYWICVNKSIKCSAICFLTFCIVIFTLLLNFSWYDDPESAPTFIIEKNLLKNLKKQEEYKEQLEKLSILNNSEIKKELTEEIENNLNNEKDNFRRFYYELKQREVDKQKKELYRNLIYRNLKKNDVLEELDNFDGIKITDKKTGTLERMDAGDCGKEEVEEKINLISPELQQWISVNNLLLPYSKIEKDNNDELNDKTEKWNPAQELLISYIKECELTVFEAEKVQDFIRNEIKAKR